MIKAFIQQYGIQRYSSSLLHLSLLLFDCIYLQIEIEGDGTLFCFMQYLNKAQMSCMTVFKFLSDSFLETSKLEILGLKLWNI